MTDVMNRKIILMLLLIIILSFIPISSALSPPTRTPINPANISQGQPSSQMSKQYSDVWTWVGLLILTLGCLVLSRDITVSTIRPALFGVVGIITSFTCIWMSLSIAYLGKFTQGIMVDYINQTNSAIFYYQVIKVVAQPWITVLCIIVTVSMIINMVDIIMMYIQKSKYENNDKIKK